MMLPDGWALIGFQEAAITIPTTGAKVKKRDYLPSGELPVIDQGQEFVGGYTDDTEKRITCVRPIVIFGDHTKVLKYVDFDFVPGADGVKVIKPGAVFYPKLFFYFLQALDLPDRGYSRHFQFLRKEHLPLPPTPEQHRIVAEIETQFTRLEAGAAALKRAQANLRRYKASVLKAACEGRLVPTEAELARAEDREYEPADVLLERILAERRARWEELYARGRFKDPVPPDMSALPRLPEGWRWASVTQVGFTNSGQTPKGMKDTMPGGPYPWFRVGDMNTLGNEKFLSSAEVYLTEEEVEELRIRVQPAGTIVFPKRGGAIATNKKRLLAQEGAYDLNTMGIFPIGVDDGYFWHWFQSVDLVPLSDGSNVPQINHGDIDPLPIPVPPLAEQSRIAAECDRRLSVVQELEKQVEAALRRAERLRQAILKHAFEGKLVPQDPNDEPASALLARIKAERSAEGKKKAEQLELL